jgi:hypothetical protein
LTPDKYRALDGYALGNWLDYQRRAKDELPLELVARLASLPGWAWDGPGALWEEGYLNLEVFSKQENHARVPMSYMAPNGFALGRWVRKQRACKDKLDVDKIARLEALPDWAWDGKQAAWEEGYRQLRIYTKEEGEARVREGYTTRDGYQLRTWVAHQRAQKDELAADRIARLEALPGWVWDARDARWEDGCRELEKYIEEKGDARVPNGFRTHGGYVLGTWVTHQRKKRTMLSTERVARLEALSGWAWDDQDARWDDGYQQLVGYVREKGDARVPNGFITSDGYALRNWVTAQRALKGKLPAYRIAKLEALPGWVWSLLEARLEEGFMHLHTFVNLNGHATVPHGFKSPDGYALGVWAGTQRSKYRQGKLLAEHIARLEALSGWVWSARRGQ